MKAVQYYDFSVNSGGTQIILAEGDYFRLQSATGTVSITVEGVGTIPNMLTGQGIKDTPFKRLVVKDTSGASNAGQILVSSNEFVDNRTYGINDLSTATLNTLTRPAAATGFYADQSLITANTAVNIFTAGSNVNGAILLSADINYNGANTPLGAFLTKATAPATVVDGQVLITTKQTFGGSGCACTLPKEQFIPAGVGLYFISSANMEAAGQNIRACRFKLL
jgi:hypothetical protein